MEELRVRLTTINANAQPLPLPRPTYSGDDVTVTKTLANVFDTKQMSSFSRNNQYMSHVNVRKQKENFSNMIASPFNSERNYPSWESLVRGNNDMIDMLYDKVDNMLASKNKPGVVDANKPIVFSYFHKGKVTAIDADGFRFYTLTLDNTAFMSHKYISRPL